MDDQETQERKEEMDALLVKIETKQAERDKADQELADLIEERVQLENGETPPTPNEPEE